MRDETGTSYLVTIQGGFVDDYDTMVIVFVLENLPVLTLCSVFLSSSFSFYDATRREYMFCI